MGRDYGISEIARELGISRQAVHQKVKKCQNPYKKEAHGRPPFLPIVNVEIIQEIKIVEYPAWKCPYCGHISALRKAKLPERYRTCKNCGKMAKITNKDSV